MIDYGLKNDGWTNLLSGLGKRGTDKTESTEFIRDYILIDEELSTLYNGEGLGAKIIDVVANDMTKAGWTINNDEEGKIKSEMKRLKATFNLNKALKYARLFRGALIVIVTERGKLEKPIPTNPGAIKQLRVYSAARVVLTSADIIDDPNSEYFEDVEYFNIQKRDGALMTVHRSRCLWFGGELATDYNDGLDLEYRYWGLSTFQRVWTRLKHYGSVERSIANLMMEIIIGKYTLSNLAQILSMNNDVGLKKIYDRLEVINASKSIINGVLLGEGETYERDSANLSGVAEVIDRMMINLSSVCDIPVTKLFGRSPAGMNATGESDLQMYYDSVSTKQDQILESELQKLVNIIASYAYGTKNENYNIEFNSLWEPTEKEKAETDNLQATAHGSDIDRGVITPEESREIRYPELEE
jgi:phage-related protein (TIGR01555 family)